MLEHQPSRINRLRVFTVTPISINPFVFTATATLLRMEMPTLIMRVYQSPAAITPDHGKHR